MSAFIEEKPGTIYGHWEIIKFHKIDNHGDARWWCRCLLCNQAYSVRGYTLRNGQSSHCCECNGRETE